MPPRLLSIPAVAAVLDVDRRTVYRFIAAGNLPVVDYPAAPAAIPRGLGTGPSTTTATCLRTGTGRSRIRVPAAGLDEFISSRAVVAPTPRR
ncbi:helix-turn-helix transcriptional regulator [Streptomyces sp. cmx-18-6]|uniref:helix-turn-helix transcriptional regulator n=1 Tax=Streptomyces sp. cmx-18-6 TaxID=2790930 RepID=UPI00398053EE